MAKTVTVGDSEVRHLRVSDEHLSPLCGATHPMEETYDRRTADNGDVTCTHCKRVLKVAVENLLASG